MTELTTAVEERNDVLWEMAEECDLTTPSTIKTYIRRFREAPPAPSSERALPTAGGLKGCDFWWISKKDDEKSSQVSSSVKTEDSSGSSSIKTHSYNFDISDCEDSRSSLTSDEEFDKKTKDLLRKCDILLGTTNHYPTSVLEGNEATDRDKDQLNSFMERNIEVTKDTLVKNKYYDVVDDLVLPWVSHDVYNPANIGDDSTSSLMFDDRINMDSPDIGAKNKLHLDCAERNTTTSCIKGEKNIKSVEIEKYCGDESAHSLHTSFDNVNELQKSDDLFTLLSPSSSVDPGAMDSPKCLINNARSMTANEVDFSNKIASRRDTEAATVMIPSGPAKREILSQDEKDASKLQSESHIIVSVESEVCQRHLSHLTSDDVQPYLEDEVVSILWKRLLRVRSKIDSESSSRNIQ